MDVIQPLPPQCLGTLTAGQAVEALRGLMLCEARYAGLHPDTVTISNALNVADGGLDAETLHQANVPADSLLHRSHMGVQLKTGTSFKPWQPSALKRELLVKSGALASEVQRVLHAGGHYVLMCFGIDFTPQQRNDAILAIAAICETAGFSNAQAQIDVLGQSQIAAYFDRYPSLKMTVLGKQDEGFLSVNEWSRHAHMSNDMAASDEQQHVIHQIREGLRSEAKHFRLIGEPGIGKSRLVLEAVSCVDLAPITLYVPQGEHFGRSALFRSLLRDGVAFPLILVIDELSERDMNELWGHLKQRTGLLKLVTIDHGPSRSQDADVTCILAPRLQDEAIKAILASHVGDGTDLRRWVSVCEGSPRVAQAVGFNLAANPDDILRPPATVPFWDRFLHGYSKHDSEMAQQVTLVMRHVALFSRFGFEDPVSDEAQYIASLVQQADPSLTWARFQEVIQLLRERRVIQGARTLFIVPWALHIYLWRQYWSNYARGFDCVATVDRMPESLQGWFFEMFRFAHGSDAQRVVKNILRPDGIFGERDYLLSKNGMLFLEALTEADPQSSLAMLEQTVGRWGQDALLAIVETRQHLVRILEMITVWRDTTVRAMQLLTKLALAENSNYANNASGTLLGLFRIGPEWAATEASPTVRLQVLQTMLRSQDSNHCRLGLQAALSSMSIHGGMRIIGVEYQGLKERADLWCPATSEEWQSAIRQYLYCLASETRAWTGTLRTEANSTVLTALESILQDSSLEEEGLCILQSIAEDESTDVHRLNGFFSSQLYRLHLAERQSCALKWQLRRLSGRMTRRDLESRFHRYVLDASSDELDHYDVPANQRENVRARRLLRALAKRVANARDAFERLLPMLVSEHSKASGLFYFGQALAAADAADNFKLLGTLVQGCALPQSTQCIGGYLATVKQHSPQIWRCVILDLLASKKSAAFGADLVWRTGFDSEIFAKWLMAYEKNWIDLKTFELLRLGKTWREVSNPQLLSFLEELKRRKSVEAVTLLVDILDQMMDEEDWGVSVDFVLEVVCSDENFLTSNDTMHGYHWNRACQKLSKKDSGSIVPLLKSIFEAMEMDVSLSYSDSIAKTAHALCQMDTDAAWKILTSHLVHALPDWSSGVLHWLHGGLIGFGREPSLSPISEFPVELVLSWIDEDVEQRAAMIAFAAPPTLDDSLGGALTRELLLRYGSNESVVSYITSTFHSGGWSGPESQYLRRKRDKFRAWLAQGFDFEICSWIEREIKYLDQRIEDCEIREERASGRPE